MPKKKQYESALGSVFDFIFTESKKPPTKQKPVKVTGVDGVNEYVDAIAATLENPGKFVNKTTVDAFNDLVNPDVTVVDFGPNEKIKFSLLNVKDALSGDMSFVDKQFKRLEDNRRLGRLAWAGEQLSGVVAATWAKKYGLDLDTQNALFNLGSKSKDKKLEVFLDKTSSRPEGRLGAWGKNRDYIERVMTGQFGNYRNMTQADFQARYGNQKGVEIYKGLQDAFKSYDKDSNDSIKSRDMGKIYDDLSDNTYQLLYPVFEVDNLRMKEEEARRNGDNRLAERYRAAMRGVDLFAQRDIRESYILRRQAELRKHQSDLKALQRSGNANRSDLRDLQKQIRDVHKELRMFRLQSTATKLGEWDGLISSISGTWEYTVGGQLVPAILSGDFYDGRKNKIFDGKYMPVDEKAVLGIKGKFKIPKVATGRGSKFMNKYYQMMTDLYYMTPTSLIKTLGTGEGFAYRTYKNQQKFLEMMRRQGWQVTVDLEQLFGSNGTAYLNSLSNVLSQERYQTLLQFAKDNEKLQKLAIRFGVLNRLKTNFTELLKKRIEVPMKAIRDKIGGMLLRSVKGESAKMLISKWMRSGGFQYLIAGFKASIKAALGVTTAGASVFVGFLIDLATDLVVRIGLAIARPVVKFGFTGLILLILSVVAIAFLIFGSIGFTVSQNQYAHVAPNEVILGETDYKIPYVKVGRRGGGIAPNLPDDVECLLGPESWYDCTQGPGGEGTHKRLLNAIDVGYLGYFFAPSFCGDNNCFVTDFGVYPYCWQNAGDFVEFEATYEGQVFKFYLVHTTLAEGLEVGSEISSKQAVGRIQEAGYEYYIWPGYIPGAPLVTGNTCSSGNHLHLEMWINNEQVNPEDILRDDFHCPLSYCPI